MINDYGAFALRTAAAAPPAPESASASDSAPLSTMFFQLAVAADGSLQLLSCSAAFRAIHGSEGTALDMTELLDAVHAEDRAALCASLRQCAEAGAAWLHEYRVARPGGGFIHLSGSALPGRATDGGGTLWSGFVADISARKTREEHSFYLSARNRLLMRTATVGLHILDADGCVVEASDQFAKLLGYQAAELAGMHVSTWDAHWNHEARWQNLLSCQGRSSVHEALYRRKGGGLLVVEVYSSSATFDGRVYISCASHDVGARKRDENELRMAAAAFEARQCMFITDAVRRVIKVNAAFSLQTGYAPAESIGKAPPIFRSGLYDEAYVADIWKQVRSAGFWSGEMFNRRKDGSVYPARVALTMVQRADGAVASYVGTEIDITAEKEAEKRITRLAYHDPLTGLPNRRLLEERLRHSVIVSRRTQMLGALLFIDLDNFKQLNDQAGHDMGDLLLVEVACRLVGSLRDADTVARLGGDEFVVVLEHLAADGADAARIAEEVCEKILAALNAPYELEGHRHHSTPSIGFTLFGEREEGVDELLKQADLAMYHAKATGRNAVRFFDPEMGRSQHQRSTRIGDIKRAIERREFELHYQPQLTMDGTLYGAEALVRWRHPVLGLLMPLEFIPLAEETGLIADLGQLVLEMACGQLADWDRQGALAGLCVSVNVSARQFRQHDFVDRVRDTVYASGAAASRLLLEVTESLLMDNIDDTVSTMQTLKAAGMRFALDDFGIAYSSLSYLKLLPFDRIKIDRAFVSDLLSDAKDAAIAATIIDLGRKLALEVVAEGVESAAQRDFLAASGCHAYQGYLVSKALPPARFLAFAEGLHASSPAP